MDINKTNLQVLKVNWFLEKKLFEFLFYSFFGWIIEVIWIHCFFGVFTNSGFLTSPFIPIYGFGAVLVSLFTKEDYSIIKLFIKGLLIATGLEFITSLIFERCFDILLWDYSSLLINIDGRVSLITSVLFGISSIIIVKFVNPILDKIFRRFKYNLKFEILLSILLIIIFIDFLWNLSKLIVL